MDFDFNFVMADVTELTRLRRCRTLTLISIMDYIPGQRRHTYSKYAPSHSFELTKKIVLFTSTSLCESKTATLDSQWSRNSSYESFFAIRSFIEMADVMILLRE